jgi:hypothetical protein
MTEEHKQKISASLKRAVANGLVNAMKGKKRSDEFKKKISETHKRLSALGLKNPLEARMKMSKTRTGMKLTEEWKNKISKTMKKNPPKYAFKKGMTPWNKGIRGFLAGEKHYLWKGGITPINGKIRYSIEYRLWREAVFARDNWTCQKCNTRGGYIEAHHIKSFAKHPELRFAIDNGKTLCKKCHKKVTWGK